MREWDRQTESEKEREIKRERQADSECGRTKEIHRVRNRRRDRATDLIIDSKKEKDRDTVRKKKGA